MLNKILRNKYYLFFIKLILTSVIIMSFFGLFKIMCDLYSMQILSKFLIIFIGVISIFIYSFLIALIWKKIDC